MSDKAKHIFISHIHEDDEVLHGLKAMLKRNGYDVHDSSINSDTPNDATDVEYIKREILAPRIRWASTLVVLVSAKTHESEYVNWEIEYAHKEGKRIVGVWDQGAKDSDLPEALYKYRDALVGWLADSVMDAINGKDDSLRTDGTAYPIRDIERHDCG